MNIANTPGGKMSNKRFVKIVMVVLVAGLSYGGVFGAGTIFGRSTAPEPTAGSQVVALPTGAPAAGANTFEITPDDVNNIQARLAEQFGGEIPPELQQRFDQFNAAGTIDPGQFGGQGGTGGRGFFLNSGGTTGGQGAATIGGFGGGTTGAIASITADGITLTTAQGDVNVLISATTSVQTITDSLLSSLAEGDQVTVRGVRAADGTITAAQISRTAN